ncbi:hypothetical protein V4S31_04500 [Enterococcus cecorum]
MTYLEEEQQIQQTLEQIKQLLQENETIRHFKQIQAKVNQHQGTERFRRRNKKFTKASRSV